MRAKPWFFQQKLGITNPKKNELVLTKKSNINSIDFAKFLSTNLTDVVKRGSSDNSVLSDGEGVLITGGPEVMITGEP